MNVRREVTQFIFFLSCTVSYSNEKFAENAIFETGTHRTMTQKKVQEGDVPTEETEDRHETCQSLLQLCT